jgi:hypothetical protein
MKAGTLPTTAAAADLLQEMEADAGVSREMGQGYFTLEERAPLFLIHGLQFLSELLYVCLHMTMIPEPQESST